VVFSQTPQPERLLRNDSIIESRIAFSWGFARIFGISSLALTTAEARSKQGAGSLFSVKMPLNRRPDRCDLRLALGVPWAPEEKNAMRALAQGEGVDKAAVDTVYLTDGANHFKCEVIEHTATGITFKVPANMKAGRWVLMVQVSTVTDGERSSSVEA
jgi:hypothetical protein